MPFLPRKTTVDLSTFPMFMMGNVGLEGAMCGMVKGTEQKRAAQGLVFC